MTEVSFTIPGEAVPKGRPRLNRKTGTLYTPKETKVYEECVGLLAKATRVCYNIEVALCVSLTIYTKKKRPPDSDNIVKAVWDGMQKGGLFGDDSQIWEFHVRRVRSANPRVDVMIVPIEIESEGGV